mmetsp:Transcript_7165/g.13231  ORF Transcript_7165/g.13231 Transcript_7165/m.13231 type:complete len:178 (-) Transcript_7165:158-691(-)|eukprot:CAMPEP_0184520714 /NCGR_PEP_ID=MMETSP0198_2-20121128/7322_1 /TAXON_ID=1112570 /ORGANISM="Thraustochytrium sp., Strain LLF1b" /LENGTH=177 /DNA_ID=CAMNT_0026911345 /DNA_START=27 /DNA_END=560 /DNA_ORIENTATION=-
MRRFGPRTFMYRHSLLPVSLQAFPGPQSARSFGSHSIGRDRDNLGEGGIAKEGQRGILKRTFSAADVQAFSTVTGDWNEVHDVNQSNAVVHGMLCANLIPALFAARLPGSVYVSQDLRFSHPVRINETLYAEIIVEKVKDLRGKIVADCNTAVYRVNDNLRVLHGKARVLLQGERET